MFVLSRAGRTDRIQRWAYNEAAKSVCKGCYIIIVLPSCDFPKQFLNMPG